MKCNYCKQTRLLPGGLKAPLAPALRFTLCDTKSDVAGNQMDFSPVQQRDTVLALVVEFFFCSGRWWNKSEACGERKKSLPTCLSCLVKPEKTNALPKTRREDK